MLLSMASMTNLGWEGMAGGDKLPLGKAGADCARTTWQLCDDGIIR